MTPPFSGTRRYRVVRPLGAGGMGAVYEVEDRATGAHVALKVMLAADARRLLRFKQEFRVMAELHHPNLVRLFDLATEDDRWFFTMELVLGQDLLRVLTSRGGDDAEDAAAVGLDATVDLVAPAPAAPAPSAPPAVAPGPACDPALLLGVLAQLVDALAFLHGHGVVHRDLKPSNVLVDLDGVVRVLDFGLASRIDRPDAISQDGVVVGTLAYLAPEQLASGAVTPASDLYALGCMLFELLTGTLPFRAGLAGALAGRLEAPPRVDERVAGVAPALVDAVARLMAIEPADRGTLDDLRAALALPRGATSGHRTEGAAATTSAELFVGRAAELASLDGVLARARAGRPQLALVAGGSGIGKSALADEVIRRAGPLGFRALRGRSYEREQVPFVAFDRILDAVTLALSRWPRERLAPLRAPLRAGARIFPALALLDEDAAPAAGDSDPREARRRAFEGVARLLAHLEADAPLLLVLDDLQWADDESLALLQFLLADGAGRVAILALARGDGDDAEHPLEPVLRRAGAGPADVTRIALAALPSDDAMAIVDSVGGGRLDAGTARALADHAGGNPFLVRRLAEHLAGLGPDGRAAILDASGSTDDVLREMLRALSPRAEQVIALAAVAGGDVPATLLRDASGLPGADFERAAGELLAGRFLKAVPAAAARPGRARGAADDAPRVDLYHDRIREVVYRGLTEERRRALHRGLALTLQASGTADGLDAEALARHWGEAGDTARRRRFAGEAAEQAATKLAFRRAARLLRVVQDEPEPGEAATVTAARWERIGELCEYAGDLLGSARAFHDALRIWDALPDDGDHRDARLLASLRLRGRAGVGYLGYGEIAAGRAMFAEGLGLLGLPLERSLPARAMTLLHLGLRERLTGAGRGTGADPWLTARANFFDLAMRAFQILWPLAAAEAALRCALHGRRAADHAARVRALAFSAATPTGHRRASPAVLARAHRLLDAAEDIARTHAVPLGAEVVQINRSFLWLSVDMARARRTIESALAGLDRAGMIDSYEGNRARAQLVVFLRLAGDHDEALALAARELEPSRTNLINASLALNCVIGIRALRGELDAAEAGLAELRRRHAGLPPTMLRAVAAHAEAAVGLARGDFAAVLAAAGEGERVARASGAWFVGILRCPWLEVLVDAAIGAARRGELGARNRRRAERWSDWLARRGLYDYPCMGERGRALLAHARGDARTARAALDRALAASTVNTSPHHRWLCLEAGRELGALNGELAAEADELAARHHFVLPRGWRTPAALPG